MTPVIRHDPVPLTATPDGVILVIGARVSRHIIVEALTSVAAAEEIAQPYPTVSLMNVYAAIASYLRHRLEVDE